MGEGRYFVILQEYEDLDNDPFELEWRLSKKEYNSLKNKLLEGLGKARAI